VSDNGTADDPDAAPDSEITGLGPLERIAVAWSQDPFRGVLLLFLVLFSLLFLVALFVVFKRALIVAGVVVAVLAVIGLVIVGVSRVLD